MGNYGVLRCGNWQCTSQADAAEQDDPAKHLHPSCLTDASGGRPTASTVVGLKKPKSERRVDWSARERSRVHGGMAPAAVKSSSPNSGF
jgi:hypothetical protein